MSAAPTISFYLFKVAIQILLQHRTYCYAFLESQDVFSAPTLVEVTGSSNLSDNFLLSGYSFSALVIPAKRGFERNK